MSESDRDFHESSRYTYGEGDLAARRLELVAELMEPSSHSFLAQAVGFCPHLALDLGGGLRHTTRLIAEVTDSESVICIERSENLLSKARASAPEGVSFIGHDITQMPCPTAARPTSSTPVCSSPTFPDRRPPLKTGSRSSPQAACSCSRKSNG